MTLTAIHVIQKKDHLPSQTVGQQNAWKSGNWSLAEATAKLLVGRDFYLHPAQDKPSHFGGKINGYELFSQHDLPVRIVFHFVFSPEYRDVIIRTGWAQEMNLVYTKEESDDV